MPAKDIAGLQRRDLWRSYGHLLMLLCHERLDDVRRDCCRLLQHHRGGQVVRRQSVTRINQSTISQPIDRSVTNGGGYFFSMCAHISSVIVGLLWTQINVKMNSVQNIGPYIVNQNRTFVFFGGGKKVRVKFSHTRHRALGLELIPVYRQSARRWREVNHAIDLAVGCHYFLPGLRLPP